MIETPLSGFVLEESGARPDRMTNLVGREHEVDVVRALLDGPHVALLTLTGPGGVGKTRLALEVARRVAGRYAHGAAFVPLAAVRGAENVVGAIARTLGLHESVRPGAEVVAEHLRDRQVLLVLDNFEHVLDAAPAVAALLRAAPDLTVLATSRASLKVYGEREYPVPPLTLPSGAGPGEAARLFVERVRAVRPDYELGPEDARDVEEIARRLDGLPLAIELAAARTRLLSPRALLARLDNRLRLLGDGPRDLPARQRTLRATLDWSFDLLAPPERALFARLGVFVGGWTLEAAEAVGGPHDEGEGEGDGGVDVLAGLAALTEHSLVGRADGAGGARHAMLETLREYALERLAARGEVAAARERLARHLAGWSDRAREGLEGPGQLEWLARVEDEQPNVIAALRERAEAGDLDTAGRLAWNLGWAWAVRVDDRAERALEDVAARGAWPDVARARVLHARAWLAFRRGRFDQAVRHAEEGLALFRARGDAAGEAYASALLGMALLPFPGRHAEGVGHCAHALALARAGGLAWLEVLANGVAGWLLLLSGRDDEAERALRDGLDAGRARGERNVATWCRLALAAWHARRGEADEAAGVLRDALASAERMNDPAVTAACLHGLAAVAALAGDDARAAALLGAAGALRAERNISPQTEPALFGPLLDRARARLGEGVWTAAEARGAAWPLAEARRAALSASGAPPAPTPAPDPAGAAASLTPSEADVLRLMAAGLSNKQIAARRGTGLYTVNAQVSAVLSKLGVANRAAATRYALEHRLA